MITFLRTVDYPGSPFTLLTGINDAGVIVGSALGQGFIFDGSAFTPVKFPAPGATALDELNLAGQATGYFYTGAYLQGFIYAGGSFSFFDFPGALYTDPIGLNNAGAVVGYYATGAKDQGFLFSGGAFTPLDYPGAFATIPTDINNAGQIVGYHAEGPPSFDYGGGFIYSAGVYTDIVVPGAFITRPSGVNDNGVIVGDYVTLDVTGPHNHGFAYANGIFYTFDIPNASSTFATDINNLGQIVGYYRDAFGDHGFLAAFTLGGDAPPIAEADVAAVQARATVTGNVLANDHDPDGDPLVVTAIGGGSPGQTIAGHYGSLVLNADGSYAYVASKNAGPQHGLAQDRFTYVVNDGHGGTDEAVLTITITQKGQTYLAGTPGADAAHLATTNGGNGKDVLDGSLGLQHVFGGNGADVLIGGPDDMLTGGKGGDLFVFAASSGNNRVTDFQSGLDQLQFDATLFASFDALLQKADQVGADVVIEIDATHSVTLAGVALSSLNAFDVILV